MTDERSVHDVQPEPVQLVCGHEMRLRPTHWPKPGELLWCPLCRLETHRRFPTRFDKAGNIIPEQWHWICKTHNTCNSGCHEYGMDRVGARMSSYRHGRKYPLHEVWLISPDGVVVERWGPQSLGAPAPLWTTSAGVAMWTKKGES
jgi:hypothetical protein